MPRISALTALLTMTLSSSLFAASGSEWSYSGQAGPQHWGSLSPEFATCGSGKNQSPVDLAGMIEGNLPEPAYDYSEPGETLINTGHTLKIAYPEGNALTLDGRRYALKQVHFHTPSEYTIDGQRYPMEAHLVHADAQGNLAVIGVMFEKGQSHEALARIQDSLPGRGDARLALSGKELSATAWLPAARDYYRLNGSLTTPPCTEGVRWLVMKDPVTASPAQLEALREAIGHANNRPLQPVNARLIVE
ncbi:carbonic anhydrase family protein [Halomonas sp. McH1-25]|uniref:carbonic anhydrase n=1 Tax=unclassified Halomonas TaxID=2609666 RepID=UPI001EF5AA05|nr:MULTISPECIES: carbonic anhydrase family protein [unclassified Halomonas]MCG7600764.1 carbonic anhydrase family protein [Halomonas sp. McH1-25]MCP1342729.1 carbonic anhydrase family protein [Halomonas sp. FL8]MCP1361034.1 carbonic anhydrase family protein [Halomonas sp. BBD45]MCP1364770.1 carbonic anhydrase family protein [Halomonas sp. BBD48]